MRLIRTVALSAIMVAGLVGAPATAAMGSSSVTDVTIASANSGEGKTSTTVVTGKRVVWLKTRRATFKEAPSAGADRRASQAAIGYRMVVVPARGPWLEVDKNKFIHKSHVVTNERRLWDNPKFAQLYAWRLIPNYKGWGARGTQRHQNQYKCLKALWNRESGWRRHAANRSGAYGIPQALPGGKMAAAGRDWRHNPKTQVRWGLGYIKNRYGSPCGAWGAFNSKGWY